MQKCAALYRNALMTARRFLATHTLQLSTMVPFACFIVTAIMAISVVFSSGIDDELRQNVYDNVVRQAKASSDSLQLTFHDYVNLAAKLSLLEPLSPRSYRGSYMAYQALKNYDLSSFKFSNLAVYYFNEPICISILGSCQLFVLFPEITDR